MKKLLIPVLLFIAGSAFGQAKAVLRSGVDSNKYITNYKLDTAKGNLRTEIGSAGILKLGTGQYGLVDVNDSTYRADSTVLTSQTRTTSGLALKENSLGNPSTNGYILSSLTNGTRSWIAPGGGGGISLTQTGYGATSLVGSVLNIPAKQDTLNWYLPEAYGAVGNASTDNAAAFTAMIAAMPARGGYVKVSKVYQINSTVTVNKQIHFVGNGGEDLSLGTAGLNSAFKAGVDNMVIFRITEDNVSFRDLTFYSSFTTPTSGTAIRLDSNARFASCSHGAYIQRVYFEGFHTSVEATNALRFKIIDCEFRPYVYAIKVSNVSVPDAGDSYITGCNFEPKSNGMIAGIWQINSGGLRVTNNKFNLNNTFKMNYAYFGEVSQTGVFIFSNNSVENFRVSGIKLVSSPANSFSNIIISGNEFAALTAGARPDIQIDSTATISIVGNTHTKGVSTTDTAIVLTNVSSVHIKNTYGGFGVPVAYRGTNSVIFGDGAGAKYTYPSYSTSQVLTPSTTMQDSIGVVTIKPRYVTTFPTNYMNDAASGNTQLSLTSNYGTSGGIDVGYINSNLSGSGHTFWQQTGANAGTMLMRLRGNGMVGIGGITTPGVQLQVQATAEQARFQYDASNYGSITTSSAGVMLLSSSANYVRINRLGIGTNTPTAILDVAGNSTMGGAQIGASITGLANTGKLYIGWNKTGGGVSGDVNLVANRGAGVGGGFQFYDYSNSDVFSHLMSMVGSTRNIGTAGITNPLAKFHIAASTTAANTGQIMLDNGVSQTSKQAGVINRVDPKLLYTNSFNIEQELPQIQQGRVTTQFNVTSSTALPGNNITGLSSCSLAAGATYRFEAILYTTSDVAAGVKFAISGSGGSLTATSVIYEAIVQDAGVLASQTRATSLGTAVGGVTAVTNAYVKITGTITVNAAGFLFVQMGQNVSSAVSSSVLVGSTIEVTQIN